MTPSSEPRGEYGALRQAMEDAIGDEMTYLPSDALDRAVAAVFDTLGLEQVGWYRPPSDYRIHVALEHRAGAGRHTECEPVYRLGRQM